MRPRDQKVACVLGLLLGLPGLVSTLLGQIPYATEKFERAEKTELYGIGQYLHSEDITFKGPFGDTKFKMDDTGLGGLGVAYHFNDFLAVHADFMFGNVQFSGDAPLRSGGSFRIEQDAFITTGRFNLDYNIINRRITPFVTAGLGYQYLETELKQLPPVTTCWWDPWWGWVCASSHPYVSELYFTWNAGAGVRWNITDEIFIKAMAGATWLQYSGASGITTQLEGIFSIGVTF
jgi:opacity protein-like surface antigen